MAILAKAQVAAAPEECDQNNHGVRSARHLALLENSTNRLHLAMGEALILNVLKRVNKDRRRPIDGSISLRELYIR